MQFHKKTLICLILLVCSTHGQFKWYLSPETGFNRNENGRHRGLSSVEGFIFYSAPALEGEWSVNGQFRSEFYGISDPDRIERYKFQTAFSRLIWDIDWQIALNVQRYVFKQVSTSAFNLIFAQLSCDYPLTVSSSFQGILSAGNSFIRNGDEGEGDVQMGELQHITAANTYLSFGGGIYTERYGVRRKEIEGTNRYSALKVGPVISLNYLKIYILRLQYRYLFFPDQAGHEQNLRLLAGRIISNRWTVFFLMDYYFRSAQSSLPVRLNAENRIYIKCGYTLSEHVEAYIKTGYFRDEFENGIRTFTRWNLLFGVEIRS